jgi:hypothetical protein
LELPNNLFHTLQIKSFLSSIISIGGTGKLLKIHNGIILIKRGIVAKCVYWSYIGGICAAKIINDTYRSKHNKIFYEGRARHP